MTSRRPGVRISSRVTLHEPTPDRATFRIVYLNLQGRRQEMSGSRSPGVAWNRANELDTRLSGRVEPQSRTLGDLVAEYVSTPVGRKCAEDGYPTGDDWSNSHHRTVTHDLMNAVADVVAVPAYALGRREVDLMRTAGGTPKMVNQLTRHVRGFLRWANRQGALTDDQAALIPARRALPLDPRFPQTEARPARHRAVPLQGQSEQYVGPEDCPVLAAVHAFADELQQRVRWGALAVHLAAGTGLRVGEQFQLRADDVVEVDGGLVLKVDSQWSTGPTRRSAPKTGRRRRVPVLTVTRDGVPLAEMLRNRVHEARAEQRAGNNPEALLFPAPEGGMWHSSNLSRLLVAAQKAAGWDYVVVRERRTLRNGKTTDVRVTQMQHTWHSLRHRFARDMIDWLKLSPAQLMAIGGWASLEVLSTRYYRAGSEHWKAAAGAVLAARATTETDDWTRATQTIRGAAAVEARRPPAQASRQDRGGRRRVGRPSVTSRPSRVGRRNAAGTIARGSTDEG